MSLRPSVSGEGPREDPTGGSERGVPAEGEGEGVGPRETGEESAGDWRPRGIVPTP